MDVTPEGILVAIGWFVSLTTAIVFAFRVIPEMAARRLCDMFGLQRVTLDNGREIYVVEDLEGKPIKIPVGIKKDADGNDVIEYGYAPLPMTMTYLAAEQAAIKVKMTLLNARSQVSKKLQKEGLEAVMKDGGGLDLAMPFIPKKFQPLAALLKLSGLGQGGSSQNPSGHAPVGLAGQK